METTVANKIVFSPPFLPSIMDVARAMAPADFEFQVIAQDDPGFAQAIQDAEYFMGFPREHMGQAFYDMAPHLKLVQLISAGYDRLDVEAARQARVPISNNGGSNSVAVAEHTLMLILAVYKQVVRDHNNVVNGKWRVGDFAELRIYELAGKTLGLVGLSSSVSAPHDLIGEVGERSVTVGSAGFLIAAHLRNFGRCRASDCDHEPGAD